MKKGFILQTLDGHCYVSDKYAKLARIVNVDRRTFKSWCDKIDEEVGGGIALLVYVVLLILIG